MTKLMQNASPPINLETLIQESLMRLGRNLLAFQRFENCIKIITPYLVPTTDVCPKPPLLDLSLLLNDRKMIGKFVQGLKDSIQSEDKEGLEKYIDEVLEHRNNFIHHFSSRTDATLNSEENCRSVIQYLDEQYKFILPMLEMLECLLKAFVETLELQALEDVTTSAHLSEP